MNIVRAGVSLPPAMMDRLSEDQIVANLMHYREIGFRICDAETRKRRVLVKMIAYVQLHTIFLT
jgi:uncharacterized metal-binding protein